MSPADLEHSTQQADELSQERALTARYNLLRHTGFQQTQVIDPTNNEPAWMWVRVWRGIREAVIASSDRSALAYRVRDAGFDPRKPFNVDDENTLWRAVGPFLVISEQLLTLDPPEGHSHFRHCR